MSVVYVVTVLVVIFVSMTLHELAHGLVANRLGDRTARDSGRLTLNPLRHVDPFMTVILPIMIMFINIATGASMPVFGGAKPVPFNSKNIKYDEMGVALVALSGPLVNLVLAFITYMILVLSGSGTGTILTTILTAATVVNLGFFAFNIIPIPPLDGSRVLYAIAPDFVRNLFDAIEQYGVVLIFLVVMAGGQFIATYMNFIITNILRLFSVVFGG